MDPKDHDILIEIKTQVTRLISDVKEIKDDTAKRVEAVEREKLSKDEFEEKYAVHDEQLRNDRRLIDFLVSKFWWAAGIGSAVTFIFGLAWAYILKRLP